MVMDPNKQPVDTPPIPPGWARILGAKITQRAADFPPPPCLPVAGATVFPLDLPPRLPHGYEINVIGKTVILDYGGGGLWQINASETGLPNYNVFYDGHVGGAADGLYTAQLPCTQPQTVTVVTA